MAAAKVAPSPKDFRAWASSRPTTKPEAPSATMYTIGQNG